jgi:hypothetical protein
VSSLSKFDKAGEIERTGKVLRMWLGDREDPVRFFCFLEDVEKLLHGEFTYVRIYKEREGS